MKNTPFLAFINLGLTAGSPASDIPIPADLVFSFFMQQAGDAGPTARMHPARRPFQYSSPFSGATAAPSPLSLIPFAHARQALFPRSQFF